ncbi:uncharacterized protein LOC110978421 [Acanthaster planci]|uniref:Centrosomal protein kizuna n=1 Tax=Acanthaster planci TaxID=133434 RepID=A0A8B7YBN3_ACAPL|nr:uncharacterized protein LOC110978421 [Acanthaster planci]
MATDNVEFYERMQKLQAVQQQREKQRLSLEQEFNSYLKSDRRLNNVRASKLQSYWAKVCEDERRSRARNEQLLREYERVEAHVAALSARTDRLRLIKDQYEKQIEMMYPRWQEQVELKRRQQLLQQQHDQQQLAQRLQELHQRQSQQGQPQQHQAQAQRQSAQHYPAQQQLSAQQQQLHVQSEPQQQVPLAEQQQLWHSQSQHPSSQLIQRVDLNDYHHLRRTSPLLANLHTQVNMPPGRTPEDPCYASIQFGTQPLGLADKVPSLGHVQPASPQIVGSSDSYEVPSAFSDSHLKMQNGLPGYGQEQASGVTAGQVGIVGMGSGLQAPPVSSDGGYMKLHGQTGGLEASPSAVQPRSSSVYAEVQDGRISGSTLQVRATPKLQPHSVTDAAEAQGTKAASAVVPRGKMRLEPTAAVQGGADPRGRPTPQESPEDDNDSIVTPLDDDDSYLEPSAARQTGGKTQPTSREGLKLAERASSAVSAKAASTARTDPFTSEEDGEDDEDSTEKEALRDVLQRQLNLQEDAEGDKRSTQVATAAGVAQSRRKLQQEGIEQQGELTGKPNGAEQPKQLQETGVQDEQDDKEYSGTDSEIGSDVSLPLSDTAEGPGPGRSEKPSGKAPTASMAAQDSRLQPKVTTVTMTQHGFWRLVSAVEHEIEDSDNIEKIYNYPECTKAIKMEIVKTADGNGNLDRLDPNAISMVVLDQVEQIVLSMAGGCLLSDKLLDTKRTITEATIRSFLYSSALSFWDKLLQHLVLLIRKGVMDAEEVASLVAPRLIAKGSTLANKAFDVLATILQNLEEEESQLDDTYSTLPSASATPSHLDTPHHNEIGDRPRAPPEVPPLDLGESSHLETPDLETNRVSHDSFFDEPAVPLTETKAYQQLTQSSQCLTTAGQDSGKGDGEIEEGDKELSGGDGDDEDDEIERATRLTPETPPSSRNKKRRNVLSSFGGSGSLGLSYGDDGDDKDTGGGAGNEGGETGRSEQVSDLISSPSPSPSPKGSGYVPSGMEQSLKSTGRSDPMQRSAAFWGEESDMEESEMSVPMGTGTLKSDDLKDDFDFYD